MAYFDKYGVKFSDDSKTLIRCPKEFNGAYVIPNGVETIAYDAFNFCRGLTAITIPSGVRHIEDRAFESCEKLESVVLPNSLKSIGYSAFCCCANLLSVVLPDGLDCICDDAFDQCENLTSIAIPESVTWIGQGALRYCDKLSIPIYNSRIFAYLPSSYEGDYSIPESINKIAGDAFFGCDKLTSIQIPNNISDIGKGAFAYCKSLSKIIIPDGVKKIEEGTFHGCCNLETIKLPNSIEVIENCAFYQCEKLESLTIPDSVKEIHGGAFGFCQSLKSISIPSKAKFCWGKYMFRDCTHLQSIKFPDKITSIDEGMFLECSSLTSIFIPNSVIKIGRCAFEGCSGLREIIVPLGQKARFLQMGLKEYADIIVERDNEELTVLFNLGKAYELGIGVTQNIAQAVLIYTQAAAKGCAEAAYRLAEWYQNGEVLPLDLNKALDLYKQAAKSGYKDAEEKAQKIQQKIESEEKKQVDYLAEKQKEQETKAVTEAQAIPYYLFFDTETAGLPPKGKYDVPVTNPDFWPRLVQLAWILTDKEGRVLNSKSKIIYPNGFSIPASATAVHHITTEHAMQVGEPLRDVLGEFMRDLLKAEKIVCHNVEFDQHIVGAELYSMDMDYLALMNKPSICTMTSKSIIDYCALPQLDPNKNGYKWPSLQELYRKLFNRDFEDAHDALADITATKDCFFELKRRGIIKE